MPRLPSKLSKVIAPVFGNWLTVTMRELKIGPSTLAYRSRKQKQTELSDSNIRKFMDGDSAPTPQTVLKLVGLMSADSGTPANRPTPNEPPPSTLAALSHSYPEVLIRLIAGLSEEVDRWFALPASELDFGAVNPKSLRSLLDAQAREWRGQRDRRRRELLAVAKRGRALIQVGNPGGQGEELGAWLKGLANFQPDLLATCIAHRYFTPLYLNMPEIIQELYLRDALDFFDAELEAHYKKALKRYPIERKRPKIIRDPDLRVAERIAADREIEGAGAQYALLAILRGWMMKNDRELFVAGLPLKSWLTTDSLRDVLG